MDRLYNKLNSYSNEDYYPMHMPGHKRNIDMLPMGNPYAVDITEIEGFDNLHQAEGILGALSERASHLYGAKKSFLLINGSTAGILAGISAATNRGDEVLLARNSHKSVFHAVALRGLKPTYSYPRTGKELPIAGGILATEIEESLIKNRNIKLVVVTSPTYEGVVSDINKIAEAVHRQGALLLVDEAHGAHFGFHEKFPKSAVQLGADLVVQSLHKTLPSFTQTAVLHSNQESINHKIEQYLEIYQTSSPSYLLMAGMDRCVRMLEENANALFDSFYLKLTKFYHSMEDLKYIKLIKRNSIGSFGIYDLDPSKLTISVRGTAISGHQLQEILRERYHIIMEMEALDYVLGMTSICDSKEGFDRLESALLAIDQDMVAAQKDSSDWTAAIPKPIRVMIPQVAMEQNSEIIKFNQSTGRVSATFVSLFPPGVPILVPGERISKELTEYINLVRQEGIVTTGFCGKNRDEIEVICNTL